jgi:hypothetical protein
LVLKRLRRILFKTETNSKNLTSNQDQDLDSHGKDLSGPKSKSFQNEMECTRDHNFDTKTLQSGEQRILISHQRKLGPGLTIVAATLAGTLCENITAIINRNSLLHK